MDMYTCSVPQHVLPCKDISSCYNLLQLAAAITISFPSVFYRSPHGAPVLGTDLPADHLPPLPATAAAGKAGSDWSCGCPNYCRTGCVHSLAFVPLLPSLVQAGYLLVRLCSVSHTSDEAALHFAQRSGFTRPRSFLSELKAGLGKIVAPPLAVQNVFAQSQLSR